MINFIRKMENLASKYKKYKDIAWERPSFLAYHVGKEIQDFNWPQTPFKPEMLPLFKRGVGWDLSLGSIRRLVVLVNWQVVLLLFKSITGRIGTYSKTDIAKLKHHYPPTLAKLYVIYKLYVHTFVHLCLTTTQWRITPFLTLCFLIWVQV